NEKFVVPIRSRTNADLRFEIFDWNQIQQSKPLGGGAIPLGGENVRSFTATQKEVPVTGVPHASGTIQLLLLWQPEFLSRKKTGTMLSLGGATRMITAAPGAVLGGTKAVVGGGAYLVGGGAQLAGGVISSGIGLIAGKKKRDGNGSIDSLPAN